MAQVATARQRVNRSLRAGDQRRTRSGAPDLAAREGLCLDRARNRRAPKPRPGAPVATRPRPMSRSFEAKVKPTRVEQGAPCSTRRSTARRQDRRRSRRVLDALAARRADAAGHRPDRRLLPLRQGADGRSRCAQDQAGQPVRISLDALPKQSLPARSSALRPMFRRSRSRRARSISKPISTSRKRPASCWSATAPTSKSSSPCATTCVRVPTSALLEGGRVLVLRPTGQAGRAQDQDRAGQLGIHRSLEGLQAGERIVTSLEREGVKAGANYVAKKSNGQSRGMR
jgi:hypothetical protein